MPTSFRDIAPRIASFLLFILLFGMAACTGTKQAVDAGSETSQKEQNLSELEERYWARVDSSRMNFTQADIDFMYGMIPHHSQALIMSRLAPENDAGRAVETLAARIINAQRDEIELMNQWLADRDQPVPDIHIDGLSMMVHWPEDSDSHAMHDHSDMPGMLSQQQLKLLSEATGTEFDRLFLTFMIEHHRGAVTMVQTLFASDGAALDREMFKLASGIHADQVTEIDRMQQMLDSIQ
ncbi:MAG: DUF305 domain-containing protein [Bacteroidetes bacterium]|jgi:uncharacterized protein (DUF305 family)|nr:DUF305 domain-containing protein [Bacteroidota bacterium]